MHDHEKLQGLTCSTYQELGLVSELKTEKTETSKEYRNMKSIIYLIHLNSIIYSERLCSFRMAIANTVDHFVMKYLCRTSQNLSLQISKKELKESIVTRGHESISAAKGAKKCHYWVRG